MTTTQRRTAVGVGEQRDSDVGHRALPYVPALDGLRAIAVLAVILYHLELASGRAAGGYLGVEVFFVVSGYLITGLLLKEHRTHGSIDLRQFWRRRARRLLPAVMVLIGAVCAYGALVAPDEVGRFRGDALASALYVQNWWAVIGSAPYFALFGRPSPLSHLWSLSIEEQFYLAWPLLLFVALRCRPRRVVLGLTVVTAAASAALMAAHADIAALERAYYGTDTRAFGLLIGAALAFVWRPGRRFVDWRGKRAPWAIDAVALFALVALLWQFEVRTEFDPWTFPYGLLWVDLLSVLLIVAAVTAGSKVGALLSTPALVWVGRRSYSLYLWHWPVFVFTRPGTDMPFEGWPANAVRLAMIVVLAELSYRFVEQPFRDGRAQAGIRELGARLAPAKRLVLTGAGTAVAVVLLSSIVAAPAGPPSRTLSTAAASASTDGDPAPTAPPSADDEAESDTDRDSETDNGRDSETDTTAAAAEAAADATGTTAPATSLSPNTTVPETAAAAPTTVAAPLPAPPVPGGPVMEPVSVFGESVTLGAEAALRERFPSLALDAEVARQVDETVGLVSGLAQQNALGPTVVVHMGNNGPIPDGALDELLAATGPRRLVLVTVSVPRRWEPQVNDTLRAFVAQHPSVALADWKALVSEDPGLTISDGVHLSPAGMARYVEMLTLAIDP